MFEPIFEGDDFSYFYEAETEQYLLYWSVYNLHIVLKDEDAHSFQEYIEMINSEPYIKNKKEQTERTIRILFSFHHSSPMPQFVET